MTEVHNHLVCDNPECGATVPVDWERAQLWETITGPERDAHLCERCAELQRQGESLDFWILRCVRCGVTSETQDEWRGAFDEEGRPYSVCINCFEEGQDTIRVP